MIVTEDMSLEPLPAGPQASARSELIAGGNHTGTIVEGTVLEAAFRAKDRLLLLTTDDVPQEEQLHVYLLAPDFGILDWATIGAMYSTGHLRDVEASGPQSLRFRFMGDTVWTVRLFDKPERGFRYLLGPRGVTRPLRLARHFTLEGTPHPDPGTTPG